MFQGKLDISQRHVRSLREGDLYNPGGIAECVSAAKTLLDAFQTQFSPGMRPFSKYVRPKTAIFEPPPTPVLKNTL